MRRKRGNTLGHLSAAVTCQGLCLHKCNMMFGARQRQIYECATAPVPSEAAWATAVEAGPSSERSTQQRQHLMTCRQQPKEPVPVMSPSSLTRSKETEHAIGGPDATSSLIQCPSQFSVVPRQRVLSLMFELRHAAGCAGGCGSCALPRPNKARLTATDLTSLGCLSMISLCAAPGRHALSLVFELRPATDVLPCPNRARLMATDLTTIW